MSTQCGNVSPAGLEQLFLDQPNQSEELASRKMRLHKLMHFVQDIAKQNVAQMTPSLKAIHDRMEALRNLPSFLESQVDGRTHSQSSIGKEVADLARACIDSECGEIDGELGKLRKVEEQLNKTAILVTRALPSAVNDVLAQCPSLRVVPRPSAERPEEPAITYAHSDVEQLQDEEIHPGIDPLAGVQKSQRAKICSQLLSRVTSSSSPTGNVSQFGFDNCGSQLDVGHMFAAMALPEVETFSDPQGKGFGEFNLRFSMKYGNLGLRDDMLVHLFFSKLDGYPKAVAEALPKTIREGGFQGIIEALQNRFKMNDSANQMRAYMELKHLKMTTDVTRYCLQLENLSRRAYPDASEEELSRTRAGELVSQLTDWPEYLQLFTTMELAPKDSVYEMVKAMAQRCECSKEIAATMQEAFDAGVQRHPHLEGTETHVVGRREEDSQPLQETKSLAGTYSSLTTKQRTPTKKQMKCYNCNKLGHLRRECKKGKVAEKHTEQEKQSQRSAGTARMFTASLSKWICGSVGATKGYDELVGRQTVTNVRLLGLTRQALLDTGSQISIIPLGMFKASLANGFDLDADVEEIPINQRAPVYDASGNRMSFKGAVSLTLQLGNGVKRRIALFVMAGGDGMLVLGTNALAKFGVSPTSTLGVLMTADRKAASENAGKTSAIAKPSNRRRRQKQQSDVSMRDKEKKTHSAEAPNNRSSAGAKLIRVGEGFGKHERSLAAVKSSRGRKKQKQQTEAVLEPAKVLPKSRINVPAAGTICSTCGRLPEMIMDEGNCSSRLITTESLVGTKLVRAAEVDKGDGLIHHRKSRGKRGSPRKARRIERMRSDRILCSSTLLAAEEQLQLRCARDISGQMDEVASPSLKHPPARPGQMVKSRSLPQHPTSLDFHKDGGVFAFFRSPSEDRSQNKGDVLKQSHTHSAKSSSTDPQVKREPLTGCRVLLPRCDYDSTNRKKKGRPGKTVKDESSRVEGSRQRIVQMNNDTPSTSRLGPSKDATRRPHRADARTRLQPKGTADRTPHHPESTTDSTFDAVTTVARTRWKTLRPQADAAQKSSPGKKKKSRDDSSLRRAM